MLQPSSYCSGAIAYLVLMIGTTLGAVDAAGTGTTYYISPTGSDDAAGTSTALAWQSVARANRQRFAPGDKLLLRGGSTFAGPLLLTAEDAGTATAPVVIASFDAGRATIDAGLGFGVLVTDAGGIEVRDLICRGSDRTRNHGSGVAFVNTLPNHTRLAHVVINHVEAHGFGRELLAPGTVAEGQQSPQGCGIVVGGNARDKSKSGFEDIVISACNTYDNAYYGILITGYWDTKATRHANARLRIVDCRAHDNPGDPLYHENHSGSGILVEDCDGGLVDRCVAWNNGALCPKAPGGPCGIWTGCSNRVIIQNCESFLNHTANGTDGDGFDIDGGCTDCVLQYNFSHDNDGAGILVYTYANAPFVDRGNVVRWNLSVDDARKLPHYGAIYVGNDGNGMEGVEIYQNTFISTHAVDAVINIRGHGISANFRNNLIIATSAVPLLKLDGDQPRVTFAGNLYWNHAAPFARVGKRDIADLAAWRTLGKEFLANQLSGLFANPQFDLAALRGVAGDVTRFPRLTGFIPSSGSPATSAAIDLRSLLGHDLGGRDFTGRPLTAAAVAGAFSAVP